MEGQGTLKPQLSSSQLSPNAASTISLMKNEARPRKTSSKRRVENIDSSSDRRHSMKQPVVPKENYEQRNGTPARKSGASFHLTQPGQPEENSDGTKSMNASQSFRMLVIPRSMVDLSSPLKAEKNIRNRSPISTTILGERSVNESYGSPTTKSPIQASKTSQKTKNFAISKREYIKSFRKKLKEELLQPEPRKTEVPSGSQTSARRKTDRREVPLSVEYAGSRMSVKNLDQSETLQSPLTISPWSKDMKRCTTNCHTSFMEPSMLKEVDEHIPTYNVEGRDNFEGYQVFEVPNLSIGMESQMATNNLVRDASKEFIEETLSPKQSTKETPKETPKVTPKDTPKETPKEALLKASESQDVFSRLDVTERIDGVILRMFEELRAENAKKDETIRALQEKVAVMEQRLSTVENNLDKSAIVTMMEKVQIMKEKASLKDMMTKVDQEIEVLASCMKDMETRSTEREENTNRLVKGAQQATQLCQEKRAIIQSQITSANKLLAKAGGSASKLTENHPSMRPSEKGTDEPCFSFRDMVEARSMGISEQEIELLTNGSFTTKNMITGALSEGICKKMSRTFVVRRIDDNYGTSS